MSYDFDLPEVADTDAEIWLRWPPNDFQCVRVVSDRSIKYVGHWVAKSRTFRRCTKPKDAGIPNHCPYCPRPAAALPGGKPIAGKAETRHLLAVELPNGEQRIWEFSDAVARQLGVITGYRRIGGMEIRDRELLGLRLVLHREPPRPNGMVIAALDPDPEAWGSLPAALDVAGLVAQTWQRAAILDGKAPTLPL